MRCWRWATARLSTSSTPCSRCCSKPPPSARRTGAHLRQKQTEFRRRSDLHHGVTNRFVYVRVVFPVHLEEQRIDLLGGPVMLSDLAHARLPADEPPVSSS